MGVVPQEDSSPASVFYNIATAHKKGLASRVQTSPLKYSILRSNAPRFADSSRSTPFGVYNTDVAHRKSLESVCRDNRRFYASSFKSAASRFPRPWTSPAADVMYDTELSSNSKPSTIEHSLECSPLNYAILRSKYKRFPDKPNRTEAPDVTYDLDRGHKQTLHTSMLNSPILYKIVGALPTNPFSKEQRQDPKALLAPGMYDYPHNRDIHTSPYMPYLPLSSMASSTPRFKHGKGTAMGLGSTWTPEKDAADWHARSRTISKAQYLRPQYMPNSYKDNAAGKR